MKYLKTFERLGISDNLEKQVDDYVKTIRSKPISKVFKLIYQCDLGNYSFKIVIDPKISSEGYFTSDPGSITGLEIHLKNREDEATLLHEVKHLDFHLRKKGKTKTNFTKAEKSIMNEKQTKVSKETLLLLEHIFYVYDENEFQSKYHSFYKDFNLFLSKQNKDFTTSDIRKLFFDYEQWTKDTTFGWYTVPSDFIFTFERFFDKDELRVVFNYIILENKRKTFKNPYIDFFSYLITDIKKDIKMRFKLFTDKENEEIEKAIKFFEKDINKRIKIYKKRMSRIVTIACERYVK